MRARIGTSGFSYKEWKGVFYPEKIKNDAMLAYYGEQFDTVEINNTYSDEGMAARFREVLS